MITTTTLWVPFSPSPRPIVFFLYHQATLHEEIRNPKAKKQVPGSRELCFSGSFQQKTVASKGQQRQHIQPQIGKFGSFTSHDDSIKGSIYDQVLCLSSGSIFSKKTSQWSLKEGHLQKSARTIPASCHFFIPHTNITSFVSTHHSKAPGTLLLLAVVFSQLQKVVNICMPWLLIPDWEASFCGH